MQLSPEARKRAVDAFKHEFMLALGELRSALAQPASEWMGEDHKMLLHRLKGGAGFLGYEHLTIALAELEKRALVYPKDSKVWLESLVLWEKEVQSLD